MREGDLWIAFFMLYYGQSYRLMKDIICRLLEDKIRRHKHVSFIERRYGGGCLSNRQIISLIFADIYY